MALDRVLLFLSLKLELFIIPNGSTQKPWKILKLNYLIKLH
jgi:hypothetical protein